MKAGLIVMVFLVMVGGLSGCGQKGPLYQEEPGQESAEKDTGQDRDTDREDTDDR